MNKSLFRGLQRFNSRENHLMKIFKKKNVLRAKRLGINEDVFNEIDFMLGSIEECNSEYLLPILLKHGIDPHGSFLYTERIPDDVIMDINETLFETGILEPFYGIE